MIHLHAMDLRMILINGVSYFKDTPPKKNNVRCLVEYQKKKNLLFVISIFLFLSPSKLLLSKNSSGSEIYGDIKMRLNGS